MRGKACSFVKFVLSAAVLASAPTLALAQYSYTENFAADASVPSNFISGGGSNTQSTSAATLSLVNSGTNGFSGQTLQVTPAGTNSLLVGNLPGGSVSLGSDVGDTVTLSFDISLTNVAAGSALRIGLFDYIPGTVVPTTNNPSGDPFWGSYGYNTQLSLTTANTGTLNVEKEMGISTNAEITGTSPTTYGTSTPQTAGVFGGGPDNVSLHSTTFSSAGFSLTGDNNVAFSVKLTLTQLASGVQLQSIVTNLSNLSDTITSTGTDAGPNVNVRNGSAVGNFVNSVAPFTSFNFLGINTGNQTSPATSPYSIDSFSVTSTSVASGGTAPEPNTLALLAGVAGPAALCLLRRRAAR